MKILFSVVSAIFFSSVAMSQSKNSDLCPLVLNERLKDEGWSSLQINSAHSDVKKIESIQIPNQYWIANEGHFSDIQITAYNEEGQKTEDLSVVNCTFAKSWKVVQTPQISLDVPKFKESKKSGWVYRAGLFVTDLLDVTVSYFQIRLHWGLVERENLNNPVLTQISTKVEQVQTHLRKDNIFPVVGIRITDKTEFNSYWWIRTPLSRFNEDFDFLALNRPEDWFAMDPIYETTQKGELNQFELFDSKSKNRFPCSYNLSMELADSCYLYNAIINPDLFTSLQSDKDVSIQILVGLDKGYLLQTYLLKAGQHRPILKAQRYLKTSENIDIPETALIQAGSL